MGTQHNTVVSALRETAIIEDYDMLGEPNWENRTLFHGDNLGFLRAMNSNTVHLIATDPPFNKSRDFHATPDSLARGAKFQDRWSWERDVHQDWVDQIKDDNPPLMEAIESAREAHSEGMGAFMCFMSVRLMEMHRVLRPDGSIYLHCDPTASHYLKACMDAVFGGKNFLNEIIWHYDGPQRPSRKNFGRKHDTILRYSKTDRYFTVDLGIRPKRVVTDDELSSYKQTDDGRYYYDLPRGDYTDASIERLGREGRIRWTRNGNPRVMYFLETTPNGEVLRQKQLHDVWSDIVSLGQAGGREKTGYPTQKPLKLYDRIIRASSDEGHIVLDPFAGCATTPVAAELAGRQWVGMDIWARAHEVVIDRLRKEGYLAGPDGVSEDLFPAGEITYTNEAPYRTDEGEVAAPKLRVRVKVKEPGPYMSRAGMYEVLLSKRGMACEGCDRTFDNRRYLQLDHNTPRADGGINHVSNRILLCGPCNNLKSNILTLSGLRRENAKCGYMAEGGGAFVD